jgi:hypothetical protein
MKLFGAILVLVGMSLGGAVWAADTATKPAAPACCGEKCKKMGDCCKTDAAGKDVCGMGGSCCGK